MKPKSNLVALSSAAIITVYAAGFARTHAAATRFDELPAPRKSLPPPPLAPSTVPIPDASATPSAPEASHRTRTAATPDRARAHSKRRASTATVDSAAPAASPATTPAPASPAPTAPAPVSPSAAPPTLPPASTPAPQPAADSNVNEKPPLLRDGIYKGWGTSRHGDIEASVEIKNGRIAEASISQCLTRYSCSWIAMLPGQVVARQSAEVDVVSGATQSTDAFYYAVLEALKKAK